MLPLVLAEETLPPLLQSLGRLHPIGVHLPIGLVFGALVVEAVRTLQRRSEACSFTAIALWIAAVGAFGACTSGWFFAESERGTNDLFWHRWLGIATACAIAAVAWLATRALRPSDRSAGQTVPIVRASVLVVAGMVAWVGHLGGNMVWGTDFVLEPLLKARAAAAGPGAGGGTGNSPGIGSSTGTGTGTGAGDAANLQLYATTVRPLFMDRCYECHGNGKHKGNLRLDDASSTLAQNEHEEWIVKPGNPAESLLIARVLLPADDDDAMPPKGARLTPEQVESLRFWIAGGAGMATGDAGMERGGGGGVAGAAGSAGAAGPALVAGTSGATGGARGADGAPALAPLSAQLMEGAAAMRARGVNISPVSVGAPMLEVSIPGGKTFTDADLAALAPYAARIERLSLARTAVTDAGAAQAPALPALRSLRADHTALSDAGLSALLSRAPGVEVVNLVETGATDALLEKLGALKGLRRVYTWNTRLTGAAIDRFRAAHPGVEFVVGQSMAGTSTTEGPPP